MPVKFKSPIIKRKEYEYLNIHIGGGRGKEKMETKPVEMGRKKS